MVERSDLNAATSFYACVVNIHEFEAEVDAILAALPDWIVDQINNLIVVVEGRPKREHDPTGVSLLGLYEGVSLADRGIDYFAVTPDQITVYYHAHMALGLNEGDLRTEIRTTILHELAHHLGIADERLHELGWS